MNTDCTVERLEDPLIDGTPVPRLQLRAGALAMECLGLGCAITRLVAPGRDGRDGRAANVVLAYGDVQDYAAEARREYFGVVVGRVANRIGHARFVLDGREHRLATNDGANHLHGGRRGFGRQCWRLFESRGGQVARVRFRLTSPDRHEGYPGALTALVSYTLAPDDTLRIEYEATATAATVVNLTQHSYFNLGGEHCHDVLGHAIEIAADEVCTVDRGLVPTGELRDVSGTPFDLREARAIGLALARPDPQLRIAGGFDHCYALRGWRDRAPPLRHACTLTEPHSGRRLRVATDQPGMQFYTGNFLDGTAGGTDGRAYGRHAGLCLETQHFPDAPNHPEFPSIVLRPGERYATTTLLRFDVLP
jgi:aldose 1-epimerase